jgi:hypothetical protein
MRRKPLGGQPGGFFYQLGIRHGGTETRREDTEKFKFIFATDERQMHTDKTNTNPILVFVLSVFI